jgi:integrase/recombinase XerD
MIKLEKAHKNFIEKLEGEGKSPATLIAYSKDIQQLMEHLIEAEVELVNEIKLGHLEEFMGNLANTGYTPKSISRKTNATRTFLKFLHEVGHVPINIALDLKHPKVVAKDPRILNKVEYRALRDAAREDLRSYAMIEMLLQTGITISELSEMLIEHLEYTPEETDGSLFIPKRYSKDRRTVPLNKPAIDAITKYIEEARHNIEEAKHLFITKTGRPLLVRNIRSTINRYFKLAGVEKAKVNDLRHTFVAHQLSQGVSLVHVSKIVGHKRVSTTERYLQFIEKEVEEEKTEIHAL